MAICLGSTSTSRATSGATVGRNSRYTICWGISIPSGGVRGKRVSTASSPYGWDIRFTYSGKRFCWHRDDHVYPLKEDKWVKRSEQTDTSRYYCFDGAKCADRAEFLAKLYVYAKYAE